jgi:hypothetical protein
VPFVFGRSFAIGVSMHVSALDGGSGSGPSKGKTGRADFSDTAYPGSVTELLASDGSPVGDFVLTSGSGTDYTRSSMRRLP